MSERDAELKDGISMYFLPDKLNRALGFLQARERLFSCSFVQPRQFSLLRQTGSIDEIYFLLFSLLFSD